jgi:hypothetical protein
VAIASYLANCSAACCFAFLQCDEAGNIGLFWQVDPIVIVALEFGEPKE